MKAQGISPAQVHALFDIVTHHEAYDEIRNLRLPDTITHFGIPLESNNEGPTSPLIQALLKRFILILPGLRDVSPDFWQRRIKELFTAFAKADLSESYDKGSIGIRKTLATASAAMVEVCARGSFGGYPKRKLSRTNGTYDPRNLDDVALAWDDFLQQIVYGDLVGRMFVKAASTDQLADHEMLVQATHEYVLVMCEIFPSYSCFV